jgi:hypothetical protein
VTGILGNRVFSVEDFAIVVANQHNATDWHSVRAGSPGSATRVAPWGSGTCRLSPLDINWHRRADSFNSPSPRLSEQESA